MKNILKASERKVVNSGGRRTDAASDNRRGRYVSSRIPAGKVSDIAVDATIRAAAPNQVSRGRSDETLIIHSSDMREKIRERKAGSLIVFVVDSSGSMGAAKRMSEAKGAVLALLNDAYQKRDMVSLVAFKGKDAFVALNPTGSIELAKKNLEDIPTGGKTPLSSGIAAGLDVIKRELQKNSKIKPLMVLISDGRGNVSFRNGNPFEEAKEIAADIRAKGIGSIVIDTESGLVRLGRLGELAEIMGGKYYGIDDLRSDRIHSIVRENI
ncbi:MAG TPA: VWA domain-containing protein [Spirochaetota bacterium]|nr:VWA domain-containing protein [Spirochaetota bacterium]HPJ35774.1 VWA domain-containing protein [Spirochaetota bacterium]